MSNASQAKIGLDARAAELREKLLRSRGQTQGQSRANNTQPPSAHVAKPGALNGAPTAPIVPALGGDLSSERMKPSSPFIPHEISSQPTLTSLPADANDIAALISSISSSTGEIPGLKSISDNSPSNDVQQKAPPRDTPPPVPAAKISIPTTVAATPQTNQPIQPPIQQLNRSATGTVNASFKERNPATELSKENGVTNTTPNNDKTAARTAAATTDLKDRKIPVARTETNACGLRPFSPFTIGNREEPPREKTDLISTRPSPRDLPRDSRNKSRIVAPILVASIEPARTVIKSNGEGQRATSSNRASHPEPVSPEDALTRLLSQVPDLKDFFEMTDYYNVEARTRKLDRFRRAKALAAQRLKIEEEERKLMAEEELEMGLQRSTVARLTSAIPSTPAVTETTGLPTPVTPLPRIDAAKDTPNVNPAKRPHDRDSIEARQEKVPRLEARPNPKSIDSRSQENGRRDARSQSDKVDSRPRAASRDPSPHRDNRDYRRSPPARPRYRADSDYKDRHKYDRYKGDNSHYYDSGRRASYPVRINLGRKGDTRFFIVKSFNEENVRRCMEDGLWTTQVQNGEILAEAFAKCRNVILFFSINKSRAFQGYARMASAPSPDTPRPTFVKGIHWDTSDPFRVEWLSKTSVEFFRIGHLKNPYNEYLPVLVGKDGQEIEPECGAELLMEMENFAVEYNKAEGVPSRREYPGGGGYGGKGPLKREGEDERR